MNRGTDAALTNEDDVSPTRRYKRESQLKTDQSILYRGVSVGGLSEKSLAVIS